MKRPMLLSILGLVCLTHAGLAQKDEKKDEKQKWDVTQPTGPTTPLSFETNEGTWMNLDVSPDGKTIVFDLLGDLYTLPIAGGAATRLTSGPAFDVQPRFSPDGRALAFTSDRGGPTNIWVMEIDGRNPRAVSRDERWFINSPTWSPDGQYVYARRHFVKERSLGAGEIWMYHASGSGGLQVTEKASFQKDAGEPAISPDGRFLYYSKDVSPGQNFEYNKDPYGVIYAIVRRDLSNGKERVVTSRPGGAVAPRPSPDGKQLAFIRRVGTASLLFLRRLETGEEWPVFDRLEKDLQEAWAIHGLYPQYAWMPDGKAIVIWGQGKFWRVDVGAAASAKGGAVAALRNGAEIPFTARVEQTITQALRFTQTVHPDSFPARMLRDVHTAPDGQIVVYSAVGHLYSKKLPDGQPARLTRDARFEFEPSFSRDGQWIVYTTWSDAEMGRVRVIRPDGGGVREVISARGHYTEPSFSPDGKWIVYRAAGGNMTRGLTHAEQPGVYIVPADGSATPRLVREQGIEPQFDHTGGRLYLRERRGEKTLLLSVDLDGSDEVVHLQSDWATQMVPSPDGRWVAFIERYQAYVGAFPRTGRPIDLGPRVEGFPVARISRDAGMYLHWSGDSRKVHWSLGPELFTRDLSRTFTFINQEVEKADEPEAKGVPIGFSVTSDKPTGVTALVGARIITMAAESSGGSDGPSVRSGASSVSSGFSRTVQVLQNGTIIVDGNRIAAIGPSSAVKPPNGARIVNVAGKTIMPGIVDVHAHVGGESDGILAEASWPLVANLSYGVTTSHDPSNDTETVFTNAELIRSGAKLGPRLFSTGTILYGAETPFKTPIETYDDALAHLRRLKAAGAFSVKSYNQQRRDVRQMIIKAGRELEMMVVPEGGSLLYMNQSMVLDGHTGVEHSLPVPNIYKDTVTLFAKSATGYTPTAIVGYGGLSGEYYFYQHDEVWKNERLLSFVPRDVVIPRSRRRTMAAEDDFNHILIMRGAKKILDAGGLVQLGAHGQLQGLGAHWELWMFVQGGMTPMEALQCATINGARYLGLDRDIGSLEKGKLADLIILDRNPLENIRNSDSAHQVMLNGRLYDAATLNEVGGKPRLPFWWEKN